VEQGAQENKMTEAEKKAAAILVQICLNKSYCVSVYDGGEWVVRDSESLDEIIDALGSTADDKLLITEKGAQGGFFSLIYGNAPDELVADYRGAPFCEEIWQEWQSQLAKEGLASDSTPA
jgi:hypothetical protein